MSNELLIVDNDGYSDIIKAMSDLPTYFTLFHLYYNDPICKHWRFGQWFINRYARPVVMPELFYEPDNQKAYKLIIDKFYQAS